MSELSEAAEILQGASVAALGTVPLEEFLHAQSKLNIATCEKYVDPIIAITLQKLMKTEYGSKTWEMGYEYASKVTRAVEHFNCGKQVLTSASYFLQAVPLSGAIKTYLKNARSLLEIVVKNWDSYIATKGAIQNYARYQKTVNNDPVHPVLYALKSFNLVITQSGVDPGLILQNLQNFIHIQGLDSSGNKNWGHRKETVTPVDATPIPPSEDWNLNPLVAEFGTAPAPTTEVAASEAAIEELSEEPSEAPMIADPPSAPLPSMPLLSPEPTPADPSQFPSVQTLFDLETRKRKLSVSEEPDNAKLLRVETAEDSSSDDEDDTDSEDDLDLPLSSDMLQ